MHRRSCFIFVLTLLALLSIVPGQALAHGEGLQQTVDGYTVTLVLPEKGFATGQNSIIVNLWDHQGNAPEATVSTALLAFTPAADGHGDSHAEAAPADDHATADSHEAVAEDHAAGNHSDAAASDDHAAAADHSEATAADDHAAEDDHAAADDHGAAASEHAHDGAGATEGQGLVAVPVALAASDELGEYQGSLAFDQPGTWTVSVVFSIDGQERGAIFDVVVAQSRPRGLVLGGFALVNGLAIATAAVLKYRTPRKPARKPATPAVTSPEEQR
jgi:hypothetical protein